MRILVISNYYPPYTLGGYEQACAVTVEWLRAQGHQVRVLTGMPPEAIAPIRREAGVVRSLRYINYEQPSYAQKWAVERHNYTCTTAQIRQFQPDIVYLWSLRLVSLAPAHAVQTWGGPQVFEMGDFWPDAYFKTGWKHRLRQQLKGCVPGLRAARLHFGPMIAVGRWMLPELQQKYNPPRTYYVPNAVPPFPRPTATREFNGPLSALFAGRLVPEKGLHLALEALAQLKRTGWVLPLRVAGHGDAEYIARCQQQADESGLEVEWLGWQDNMAALYAEHDLFLMPTLMREPFGLVLLQAMQAGMLVWASKAYGPAEIVRHGETGFLFPAGDANALAQSLADFLRAPQAGAAISARAQRQVQLDYSLHTVKSQIETILIRETALQKGIRTCLTG